MTVTLEKIDERKYGRLLARALPRIIKTEEENETALAEVERLMAKGEGNLTPEEDRLFELLVRLIEDFEAQAYPMEEAPPHRVLQHLMEARDMRQIDLLPVFGSRGIASEVVNGKRNISKAQAKKLAAVFHVSPEIFI